MSLYSRNLRCRTYRETVQLISRQTVSLLVTSVCLQILRLFNSLWCFLAADLIREIKVELSALSSIVLMDSIITSLKSESRTSGVLFPDLESGVHTKRSSNAFRIFGLWKVFWATKHVCGRFLLISKTKPLHVSNLRNGYAYSVLWVSEQF